MSSTAFVTESVGFTVMAFQQKNAVRDSFRLRLNVAYWIIRINE